jgi:starch-binding outer membrane protein, SusD/RagB family
MKTNKLITIISWILVFSLLVPINQSCTDDWLDPKPKSFLSPEITFTSRSGIESALNSCRSMFQLEFGRDSELYLADYYLSDLAITVVGGIRNAVTQMLPTGAGETEDNWIVQFRGINLANLVISRTPLIDESEDIKNMLIAEGYFHRAYWYYRLVNQFGDVPLILEETTSPKLDFYSSTRNRILNKMKEDMEFAVQFLPETALPGAVGRAAGKHLLAQYYLALGEFDNAIATATKVIEESGHYLMTERFGVDANDPEKNVFWDLFCRENISLPENKEALMVNQNRYMVDGGGRQTRRMRSFVSQWYRDNLDPDGVRGTIDGLRGEPQISRTGRGIGKFKMTQYHSRGIWDCPNDVRHQWPNWFPMDSIYYNNPRSAYYGQPVMQEYCTDTIRSWDPFMYAKVFVYDDERPAGEGLQPQGGHTDWYIFRLAETYLLRAEAYVWNNNLTAAATDINTIRARVNASPIPSGQMSIETILDERARELFLEEFRKSEITRIAFTMAQLGLRGYSMENIHQSNYWYDRIMENNEYYRTNYVYGTHTYQMAPHNFLWPVPINSIESNTQGVINQNYGYPGYENNVPPIDE